MHLGVGVRAYEIKIKFGDAWFFVHAESLEYVRMDLTHDAEVFQLTVFSDELELRAPSRMIHRLVFHSYVLDVSDAESVEECVDHSLQHEKVVSVTVDTDRQMLVLFRKSLVLVRII